MAARGKVILMGAGPGDPELLTVKAARLLQEADVIVHDRLVSEEILALASPMAALLPVGKKPKRHPVPQEQINKLLIKMARGGLTIVRLKGGDPLIFGRGSEEALALKEVGIPFEFVPGITAAQGCAISAMIPLTHRGLANSVRYVTGHLRDDDPLELDWRGLSDPDTTLVLYMSFSQIGKIAGQLLAEGLSSVTPVAAIASGTCENEKVLRSSLGKIAEDVVNSSLSNPTTFIIGKVAGLDLSSVETERLALCYVNPMKEAVNA